MAPTRKRKGLLSSIYRPVGEVIGMANNVSHTAAQSVDKIVHAGLSGVNKIGKNVMGRADTIIYDILPRGKKGKGKGKSKSKGKGKRTRRHR